MTIALDNDKLVDIVTAAARLLKVAKTRGPSSMAAGIMDIADDDTTQARFAAPQSLKRQRNASAGSNINNKTGETIDGSGLAPPRKKRRRGAAVRAAAAAAVMQQVL
jgi:hypothetical protein